MLKVPVVAGLQRVLGVAWLSVDLMELLVQRVLGVVRLPVDLKEVQLPEGLREALPSKDLMEGFMLRVPVRVQRATGITFMAPPWTMLWRRPEPVVR
jgi:hypothetical protein